MYERHDGDDLLPDDPRLKCKWEWSRIASLISNEEIETWTHFQVSKAYIKNFKLSVIQWGNKPVYYEAAVGYGSFELFSTGSDRETGIKTRIEAQIKAEEMLMDWIAKEYKYICSILAEY